MRRPVRARKWNANLTGIDFGEEIAAEHENQSRGKHTERQEAGSKQGWKLAQRGTEGVTVALTEALEAVLKAC